MEKCKRCAAKTSLGAEDIEKMVEEITSMRGVRLAEEALYKKRFGICAECEKFMYGSTCMLCGCVMQVRARLIDGKCPNRKW